MKLISTDGNDVNILMFEDPTTGPRKLPEFNNALKGKIPLNGNSIFETDVENQIVRVKQDNNGQGVDINRILTYIVG